MNLTLKAVYICVTQFNKWGKGATITEAKKNAALKNKSTKYYVMAALFNDPTEEEFNNLFACVSCSPIDGTPQYYQDGRTEEDTKMINDKHVGWLTVEKNL